MKLTPLDIHHKEFRRSLRGYDDKEVDDFLDSVADEFERLFKENIDLSERMEAANQKVRTYQDMETTLHNTLLAAQRSAEEIVATARDEAGTLLRDAEMKAKEVIHDALTQKQKMTGELVRVKQAEEEFRARFKQLLEQHLASVREVALPEDVNLLVGKTDEGVVAEVEVAAESALAALEQVGAEAEAATVFPTSDFLIPVEAPEPEATESEPPATEPADTDLMEEAWVTQAMPPVEEPPASGFVTGVTLGETEPPDLPVDIELGEPREFTEGSFDALGEREDDIDIEEID
ncbi:MAG: DivIVA domain-containing protein [Coriobacteriia bacterium]|nr:DivIVA domain-containing protein [Coriobacteriia bacterium]